MDEWRNIIGYEGLYEVSNLGRVKSVKNGKNRVLKPHICISNNGQYKRLSVVLSKNCVEKQYYIHKLVAIAFPEICGDYFDGAEIDHIDGNATNNNVYNLRWVSHTDNMNNQHFKKLKSTYESGKQKPEEIKQKISQTLLNNKHTSKPLLQYDMEGNFIREWPSYGECKRAGYPSAWDCARGLVSSCKDRNNNRFVFKFK